MFVKSPRERKNKKKKNDIDLFARSPRNVSPRLPVQTRVKKNNVPKNNNIFNLMNSYNIKHEDCSQNVLQLA